MGFILNFTFAAFATLAPPPLSDCMCVKSKWGKEKKMREKKNDDGHWQLQHISHRVQHLLCWNYRTDLWPSNVKNFINKILMLFKVRFFPLFFSFCGGPQKRMEKKKATKPSLSYDRATIYIVYFCLIYVMGISWPRNVSLRQSHTLETSSVFRIFFYYFNINFFSLSLTLPEYLWVRTQFIIG